jgi:hypothetical protein
MVAEVKEWDLQDAHTDRIPFVVKVINIILNSKISTQIGFYPKR